MASIAHKTGRDLRGIKSYGSVASLRHMRDVLKDQLMASRRRNVELMKRNSQCDQLRLEIIRLRGVVSVLRQRNAELNSKATT